MNHQWYKSTLAKSILIVLEHILLVIIVVSFLWMMSYPALWREALVGEPVKAYEDTTSFNEQLRGCSNEMLNAIGMRDLFETDGKYDPQKIVDIQTYYNESKIDNENVSGLSYRVEELVGWGDEWYRNGEESNVDTGKNFGDNIIVCKRPDNTYHYYYYKEFRELITSGELKFVMESDGQGDTGESILSGLREGNFYEGNSSSTEFKGLQDAEGKIAYIDCWSYDGIWVEEKYKPIGAKSVMELANDNPEWNGRLSEAYEMLHDSIYRINDEERSYQNLESFYLEGDTNFAYLYVDTDTKRVYSNRKEFKDYSDLEKSLDKFRGMGRYVVIMPELADFETNLNDIEVSDWRDEVKYSGNKETGFIYAAGVDTSYPIKDAFYSESRLYEKYGSSAKEIVWLGIAASVMAVFIIIWLTIVAGRSDRDDGLHLNVFDRWKTELAAGCVVAVWIIPILLFGTSVSYVSNKTYDVYGNVVTYSAGFGLANQIISYIVIGGIGAAYTCAVFLTGYLSLVRRIKAGELWKNSILRCVCRFVKEIFLNMHAVWKAVVIFGLFVLIHWLVIISSSVIWVIIMLAAESAAFIYLVKQAIGKHRINTGVDKIAKGEVDYKIPLNGLGDDQRIIAEKVNSIGEGLDAALERSMKSERLKTDLITNVSHDIKTPLTSIINYVELLKQENFEDPRIQRYIEVLEAKSQRLKTLTEDVVEASKVSSGNITLEYMNINLVEMIQQTSGEFEEKFSARNLKEVMSLPDREVIIWADGRRLWRVLANIYSNAAKYAMEGTRVYTDLYTMGTTVIFSLKNISDQPLNISADELTERFIRGDISRSTEGSGLGLSIAKTLTEMQGGKFELYLDGDLFRVTITFPIGTGQN